MNKITLLLISLILFGPVGCTTLHRETSARRELERLFASAVKIQVDGRFYDYPGVGSGQYVPPKCVRAVGMLDDRKLRKMAQHLIFGRKWDGPEPAAGRSFATNAYARFNMSFSDGTQSEFVVLGEGIVEYQDALYEIHHEPDRLVNFSLLKILKAAPGARVENDAP